MAKFSVKGVVFDVINPNLDGKSFTILYYGKEYSSRPTYKGELDDVDHDTGYAATRYEYVRDLNEYPEMAKLRVRVFWNNIGQYRRGDVIVEYSSYQRAPSGDLPLNTTSWLLVGNVS